MKTIFLVRHGDVNYDTEEYSLSLLGREQLEKFGTYFKTKNYPIPEIVFSSDRPRAIQSAQCFANGLGRGLKLIGHVLEGASADLLNSRGIYSEFNPVQENALEYFITNAVEECNPPEEIGTAAMFTQDWPNKANRIKEMSEFIENQSKKYDSFIVFSHANILKLVLDSMFQQSLDLRHMPTNCHNAALTIITIDDEQNWKIAKLFSKEHLL